MMKIFPFFLIIMVLVVLTLQRNAIYRSEVGLWEDGFRKSPNKPRVLFNLAYAYKKAGEDERAVAALTRAFEIQPDLMIYVKAMRYASDHGGKLITEKDVWNR